uniref:Alternative protein MDM1 n=1 Tax=Homo sapiens TaxID=9606 RepID=L8E8S4_HUMAN|nr:alternative protein MDM1 [Homo sapiens]
MKPLMMKMRTDCLRFLLALQLLVSGLFKLWHELRKGRRISGVKHKPS